MKRYAVTALLSFALGSVCPSAGGQTFSQQILPVTGLPSNANIVGIGADSAANVYFLEYNTGVYEAPRSTTSYSATHITSYTNTGNNPQLTSLSVTNQGIPYWGIVTYGTYDYGNVAAGTDALGVVNLPDPPGAPTYYADPFPLNVAVNPQGTIAYASSAANRLYEYDFTLNPNGTPASWQISGTDLTSLDDYIYAMALAPTGYLYITTGQNSRLYLADISGSLEQIPVSGLQGPCHLAIDPNNGNIYLADPAGAQIIEVSWGANGYTQTTIESGTAVSYLAIDSQENLYGMVGENAVLKLSPTRGGGGPRRGGGGN